MSMKKEIMSCVEVYTQRTGRNMTQKEYQALVLNLAYLLVMRKKREGMYIDEVKVLTEYSNAAQALIPETPDLKMTLMGYLATLQWDGLWDYLREYFDDKLGIAIDDEIMIRESFNSSFHRRYEDGILVSEDEANRIVSIQFSQDKKECIVRISPTLSDKKAILSSVENSTYTYSGTDPDYKFIICYDIFGSIEKFSLIRTDRELKIDYLE